MPKRSAQSRIERYTRKIRKLEEQQNQRRTESPPDLIFEDNDNPELLTKDDDNPMEGPTAVDIPQESGLPPALEPDQPEHTVGLDDELDPELLTALGESTCDIPEFGDNIHNSLTNLWLPLLRRGLPKDNKEKILKDYLIPGNCKLLQAPKLNAEISAAVPDMVRNRDKTVATTQNQLGVGISAISKGMNILLNSDNKLEALKHLSNGCRLLCDSHNQATVSRIKLITPSLDKTILHMIADTERDETLFGSSLSEKIKAAKAIEKQGQLIKKPTVKPQKSTPVQSSARTLQGNWSAPPRYPSTNRGGRGGYKKPLSTGARRSYATTSTQPHRATPQDRPRALAANRR